MGKIERQSLQELRRLRLSEQGEASKITSLLFDENTFAETCAYMKNSGGGFESAVTGYGAVSDRLVYTFIEDGTRDNGGFGAGTAKKLCALLGLAKTNSAPVVGFFDSEGAYVREGIDILAAYGDVIRALHDARKNVPLIAVVNGVCSGASAIIARMFDIVITAGEKASIYVNPPFLTGNTDENAAGTVDIKSADIAQAIGSVKRLLGYLPSSAGQYSICSPEADDPNRLVPELADIVAAERYDVCDVIKTLADGGEYALLGEGCADELCCGFMRLYGIAVGFAASNPAVKDGALTVKAALKAARMVKLCGRLGLGMLTLVDTAGYLCGADEEKLGMAEAMAELSDAYLSGENIKVTAVTGRAYGSAFTVLGSKSVGVDYAIAAEGAAIAPMPPETAVQFMYFDKIKEDAEPEKARAAYVAEYKASAGPVEAARGGEIDDAVPYTELRTKIISAFEMLSFRL